MPTYEYSCPKCGVFEQFHSINSVLTKCPKCDSEVQRLISRNNNVIFKGSGFHTTDYRSGDYKSKSATDSSSSSTPTTPTKKDDKPAEPKETKVAESKETKSVEPKSESKAPVSAKNESKAS